MDSGINTRGGRGTYFRVSRIFGLGASLDTSIQGSMLRLGIVSNILVDPRKCSPRKCSPRKCCGNARLQDLTD